MPKGTCSEECCEETVRCRGLCSRHYRKMLHRQRGEPVVIQCAVCGDSFEAKKRCAKYCSQKCSVAEYCARARSKRSAGRVWNCQWCAADISHMRADAKYCSDVCANRVDWRDNRERILTQGKRYAQANRDKLRAANRSYRHRNRKRIAANQVAWVVRNRERLREYHRQYSKAWSAKNKHREAVYIHNRHKRIKNNRDSVKISPRDWLQVLRRYDHRCAYCGAKPETIHMDHVVPLARGGRHAIGNVLPACPPCNFAKGARFVMEWRLQRMTVERLNREQLPLPQGAPG